jgi:hypothetical protein
MIKDTHRLNCNGSIFECLHLVWSDALLSLDAHGLVQITLDIYNLSLLSL